ncbi:MAG: hypothetical protein PHS88_11535, partial [Candidatus Omnitrophica bacterium]|nr:hypothetical protein [Candidatus Omnitrophota bacterium]
SFFIGKTYEVPGARLDGSFVLGDFESENGVDAWETKAATAEISGEHAASGLNSARVVFHPGKEANFQLEQYFTSRHAVFDWSLFRNVGFYIFNPAPDASRVLFQVGDRKGRFYKDQFFLNGNTGESFTVPMSKIAAAVNVKRIAYIRFFIWAPNKNCEFFFDDVQLEKT